MNTKQAQLTNIRDCILNEVRKIAWQNGVHSCPVRRLMRGELMFGDGILIQYLATLIAAELGVQDEYDAENKNTYE